MSKNDQKNFFRKSAFFWGRCAKMEKSIWALHPGFSSPQIGLENWKKTSLARLGKFRTFDPKKRTFSKKSENTGRDSSKNHFLKIEKSKISKVISGVWVEFGNQKVGQNGVIFEIGPIGKTV